MTHEYYGMASNGTYENNDNPKSYEAMLNAIVIHNICFFALDWYVTS